MGATARNWISIPGQPVVPAPMPMGAPAIALGAIALEGLRHDGLAATWRSAWAGDPGLLLVTLPQRWTRSGNPVLEMVWGVLWTDDAWQEHGWHCRTAAWSAMTSHRQWLWDLLNPGKRPPRPFARYFG